MKRELDFVEAGRSMQRAIDESLFDWPSTAPALLANKCSACGVTSFPRGACCPSCGSLAVAAKKLPSCGTLWTWTIQRFMPKSPYSSSETEQSFVPFGLGYVDLAVGIRVETRLLENDPGKLRIGMPLELAFYVHRTEVDGTEIVNYAFKPIDSRSEC